MFSSLTLGYGDCKEKRIAERCFRVFYEPANQTVAEAKIPDFIGHY